MNDICNNCQFEMRCGCRDDEHEYKLETCQMYEMAEHNRTLIQESEGLRRRLGTLQEENRILEAQLEHNQQQAAELEAENRNLLSQIKWEK